MASVLLSSLMNALGKLAEDNTLSSDERTLAAELAIKGYLATNPTTRQEMLDALENEIIGKSDDFWNAVGEIIGYLRPTA